MTEKPKKLFFWGVTLLFPFLFLLIIEIGLRIGGYNSEAQDLFVPAPSNSAFLVSNTSFIKRYFPSFVPKVAPNAFRKQKRSNTFRVFVFGGSSTQGFPYNFYYSFADKLEQKLLLNTEGVNVEVINLGMTAVNSYVIRDLSKRVIQYEPDAVLIYAGHNEYYGSFGVASTQFGFVNNVSFKRLIIGLKNWRLYQLLESIASSNGVEAGERRTMMAKVISNSNIELGESVYSKGLNQFEDNIGDVLALFNKNKIPVYIGTVTSNLKSQAPLTDQEAVLKIYETGNDFFNKGDSVAALSKFIEAKELDGIRFRAPNEINKIIRKLANRHEARVIEIEDLLRKSSESGIEDESLFIDHLHPNYVGHQLMADLFFEHLMTLPYIASHFKSNEFDTPNAISQFEKAYADVSIARLLVGYPFQKDLTVDQELAEFQKIYDQYLTASYIDSMGAVASRTMQFVPEVLIEVINQAQNRQDSLAVVSHYFELMKWQLNSIDLLEKGIEYAVNNRETDVYLANMILQFLNDGVYDSRYIDVLSSLYLLRDNTNNAEYWLKQSERLEPNSPRMLYNNAHFYLLNGDSLKGQQYFKRYLQAQQNR